MHNQPEQTPEFRTESGRPIGADEAFDYAARQANEDLAKYLESRPYQDPQGHTHDPETGQFISPDTYFSEQEERRQASSPGEKYENMGMPELARISVDAKQHDDKSIYQEAEEYLLDKMTDLALDMSREDRKEPLDESEALDIVNQRIERYKQKYREEKYGDDIESDESEDETTELESGETTPKDAEESEVATKGLAKFIQRVKNRRQLDKEKKARIRRLENSRLRDVLGEELGEKLGTKEFKDNEEYQELQPFSKINASATNRQFKRNKRYADKVLGYEPGTEETGNGDEAESNAPTEVMNDAEVTEEIERMVTEEIKRMKLPEDMAGFEEQLSRLETFASIESLPPETRDMIDTKKLSIKQAREKLERLEEYGKKNRKSDKKDSGDK